MTEYESRRKRPMLDRAFGTRKIFIFKEASYERVLEKCRSAVFPEAEEGAEYYLADSGGVRVENTLIIDEPDGRDRELPWTLESYLQVSRIKYQSKARFNVVKRKVSIGKLLGNSNLAMYVVNHWVKSFIGDEEETTTHDLTEDTSPAVAEGAQEKQLPTTTPTAVKPTSVPGIAAIQPSPASLRPPTPTASESEPMDIVPDEGIASGKLMSDRFNLNACMCLILVGETAVTLPLFLVMKRSPYSVKFSAINQISQADVLGFYQESDVDLKHEVQEAIITFQSPFALVRPENPCHMGAYFSALERGNSYLLYDFY